VNIHDIGGQSHTALAQLICRLLEEGGGSATAEQESGEQGCAGIGTCTSSTATPTASLFVVAPASMQLHRLRGHTFSSLPWEQLQLGLRLRPALLNASFYFEEVASTWPHLSTEDPPWEAALGTTAPGTASGIAPFKLRELEAEAAASGWASSLRLVLHRVRVEEAEH
jgi:hypothetical protein